jgi:hypothetical protein
MLYVFLGKIFFPRLQPWEQRRKTKMMAGTLFAAGITAACVGVVIYHHNR